MYDYKIIEQELKTKYFGRTFIQFEKINSVHKKAKNISSNCPTGMVILTENQDNIKLKNKKIWNSDIMNSIYMSVIVKDYNKNDKNNLNYILQIFNASICKTLNDLGMKINCKVKWPNDLLVNGKKVCSVFVEEVNKKDYYCIISSLYLNLKKINKNEDTIKFLNNNIKTNENKINNHILDDNNGLDNNFSNNDEIPSDEEKEVGVKEISLYDTVKVDINKELLVANILNNLEILYESFLQTKNIELAANIIKDNNVIFNKNIGLRKYNKKTVKNYKVIDIDLQGNIVIVNKKNNNKKTLILGQDIIEWWIDDKET